MMTNTQYQDVANPEKFLGRYRMDSARLSGYDYTKSGQYFVTICTKYRVPYFGMIQGHSMKLSEIGAIVADEWLQTEKIRPYVTLGEWVIMPDHMHGIIDIHDHVGTPRRGVPTNEQNPRHHREWKSGCLGAIINQFKSKCTKRIRVLCPEFSWQSRFYDRIIRNKLEQNRICTYILNNPRQWHDDMNHNLKYY